MSTEEIIEIQCEKFAFDCQELSQGSTEPLIDRIKKAMEMNIDNIDVEKSYGSTVTFKDGSTATLKGHNWIIKRNDK